jgi:hypothetical protein
MKKSNLKCPCCETELVLTHQGRYQDLCEHVSQPNREPSLKDAYQCPNEYCVANNLNASWIEGGEIFINPPEGIKWTVAHRTIEKTSVSGMYWALNSWQHHYEGGKKAIARYKFSINLYWYKFDFEPDHKGHKYPIEIQYQPNLWKWKTQIWKRQTEPYVSWVGFIPFWTMVKFLIDKFNREYLLWKENGNKNSLNECFNTAMGIASCGAVDDRNYAKFTKYLLQILKPQEVNEIITAYNQK